MVDDFAQAVSRQFPRDGDGRRRDDVFRVRDGRDERGGDLDVVCFCCRRRHGCRHDCLDCVTLIVVMCGEREAPAMYMRARSVLLFGGFKCERKKKRLGFHKNRLKATLLFFFFLHFSKPLRSRALHLWRKRERERSRTHALSASAVFFSFLFFLYIREGYTESREREKERRSFRLFCLLCEPS